MSPNKNNKDIKLNNNGSNSNALVNNEIKTNTETKNPSQNKKLDNNNQKNLVRKNKNIPIIQNIRLNKNGYEEILNKNNQEESIEILEINEKINSKNEKHPKQKKDQDQSKEKISIHKKIKDLNVFTHVGFDGEQEKANNQDNYFIKKNFAGHKDYIFMSVCDGHGLNGHHVSNFIKTILPIDMSENLKHCNILTETEKIHEIIRETFIIANDKLVENQEIDCIFSGTTCVSVIFTPEKLICPNIGDSRAVLARYNKNEKKYIAIDLTRDHKPTELDEKQRIIENDGKIQPFIEDGEFVGPERIWIKEEDIPGLAMTRSLGDRVAATVGVISEPEIKEFYLDENDKFMIIASDGIWEFISSQECVDITSSYYEKNDIKGCCQYLYAESSKRWLKEEEVIDDTTLILVFFE
jgi:serine/threonine protein phosphatase PrpC